jgi:hypothetical protein
VRKFLEGATAKPSIRRKLEEVGLDDAECASAWRLLAELALAGDEPAPVDRDEAVVGARARLAVLGPSFARRVEAAALRVDPGLAQTLFARWSGSAPLAVSVPILLDAVAALANDPRPAAATLIAVLRKRRLGEDAQAELRLLVDQARGVGAGAPAAAAPRSREAILLALYRWWREWAETARATLPRRADQIRLGIARPRRPVQPEGEAPAPAEAPTPAGPSAEAPALAAPSA